MWESPWDAQDRQRGAPQGMRAMAAPQARSSGAAWAQASDKEGVGRDGARR